MQKPDFRFDTLRQNNKLAIRLVSPTFGHLPPEILANFSLTHRKNHYHFLFMLEGRSRHGVDLQQFEVNANELLFVLPHQMHQLPLTKEGTDYFKLGFDETSLSLLPRQYPFLINPFNQQKITLTPSVAGRLRSIFQALQDLLSTADTNPELILAHLNSLMTEINSAYFLAGKSPVDDKLSKYIGFKVLVENNLTNHLAIKDVAEKLTLNTNSLYSIVKHYSGLSPKEFITGRLILEAKRRLCYGESSSIKELAFGLGFNDPEYFSRLFKKTTGKTVAGFVQDLSGN